MKKRKRRTKKQMAYVKRRKDRARQTRRQAKLPPEPTYLGQTYGQLYRTHGHLPARELSPQMRTIFELRAIPPDLNGTTQTPKKRPKPPPEAPKWEISAEDARVLSLALSWVQHMWEREAEFGRNTDKKRVGDPEYRKGELVSGVLEDRLRRLRVAVRNLNAVMVVTEEKPTTEDDVDYYEGINDD